MTRDEVDGWLSREPDPQFTAAMAEQCQQLLKALDDSELEQVAIMRLDGYSNAKITDDLSCTRQTVQRQTVQRRTVQRQTVQRRTVQRRLRLIRQIWESP